MNDLGRGLNPEEPRPERKNRQTIPLSEGNKIGDVRNKEIPFSIIDKPARDKDVHLSITEPPKPKEFDTTTDRVLKKYND